MESSLMKMSVTPCSCIAPQDSSITRQIVASIPQPSLPSSISVTNASTSGSELTRSVFSRSLIALLSCFSLQEILVPVHPAMAFSVGISGPKEWLKNQKKKTSDFLIAPIIASRKRLESAVSFAETASPADIEAAQKLVKSAARDCIKPEDGSLVAFQQKTGVEVCTFRLILKNAASLLDDSDPVKLNASLALDNLISSFTSLNDVLVGLSMNADVNRMAVADAFSETNRALDNFEKGLWIHLLVFVIGYANSPTQGVQDRSGSFAVQVSPLEITFLNDRQSMVSVMREILQDGMNCNLLLEEEDKALYETRKDS